MVVSETVLAAISGTLNVGTLGSDHGRLLLSRDLFATERSYLTLEPLFPHRNSRRKAAPGLASVGRRRAESLFFLRPSVRPLPAFPRMIFAMRVFQSRSSHVRINLSGRDIGMAEHRLHGTEIGAAFEKVGGEGMA